MAGALKLFLATLVVAGITAGVAAAGGSGSGKFPLLGPDGNAFCDGSGVLSGQDLGFGFAVINAPSNGTVSATVSAKALTPNTTYNVLLIQGVADCFTPDTTLTTNGQGNGNAHWSEADTHSGTAFIAVCNGPCGTADSYVTNTYFH